MLYIDLCLLNDDVNSFFSIEKINTNLLFLTHHLSSTILICDRHIKWFIFGFYGRPSTITQFGQSDFNSQLIYTLGHYITF